MFDKLKQAKQMAEAMKEKLEAFSIEAEGADGKIKVWVSGNRKVKEIFIHPDMLLKGETVIQEELMHTINKALDQAEQMASAEMQSLMGGMMPGLGSLFGK